MLYNTYSTIRTHIHTLVAKITTQGFTCSEVIAIHMHSYADGRATGTSILPKITTVLIRRQVFSLLFYSPFMPSLPPPPVGLFLFCSVELFHHYLGIANRENNASSWLQTGWHAESKVLIGTI